MVLFSKLKSSIVKKHRYSLMEFDLFTLCDMSYSRLQSPKVEHPDENDALFYAGKYNQTDNSLALDILDSLDRLLEEYIEHHKIYNPKLDEKNRIFTYFKMMRKEFRRVRPLIEENRGKNVEIPYVSPIHVFERICKLGNIPMIGWDLEKDQPLSNDVREKRLSLWEEAKENLLDRILEAVYIAILFLPDELPENKGYRKNTVINLILLSELGKLGTGDYTPNSENEQELAQAEMDMRAELLAMGAVDGFANLKEFYYLFAGENGGDINLIISREIMDIQREYKYYTLSAEKKLNFDEKRRRSFESDLTKINTPVCVQIKRRLIIENPKFKEFL